MTGEENETVEKREMDPIIKVCLVVLMLASVAVLGVYINDNFISPGASATTGDTVEVDYIGTLYGEYGNDVAAVFDTTLWSVADDDSVLKTNSFTVRTESAYKPSSVTIGDKKYIAAFENAIIGMKVGETKNVTIPAESGYYSDVASYNTYDADHEFTCGLTETFPKATFESIYGVTITSTLTGLLSPYGWPASASLNSVDNTVVVSYFPETGREYTALDNDLGKVLVNVESVTGGVISYTYDVASYNSLSTKGNLTTIQQLEVKQGIKTLYIDAVEVSGAQVSAYELKDISLASSSIASKEIYNEVLYFQITLKAIGTESA